ncbi:hypothetical protein A33M_1899 [Rhodovulum sp. PH10]|uniref:hypothetical protein n=1 Tax=Rhodovulum sp. PH10 TaxID=1187851 RepID=UPI00027C28D3|nr:hypothetical protein [Rhodovulum sp. PH10]EJW12616.1 hypothetical protein A33M_1899 [Rhodovulum sp. PH10]
MSRPLALPTVTNRDALAAVKSLDMPPSQRPAVWRERWHASAALQREFADADRYSSYMEGLATERIRLPASQT